MKNERLGVMENAVTIKSGKQNQINSTKSNVKSAKITSSALSQINQDSTKLYRYCLRCGKRLKSPEAQLLGYGPVCMEKMKITKNRRLFNG